MTAKQFWACTALSTLGSLIVIGAIALLTPHAPRPADPTPAPVPVPVPPAPAPTPDVPLAIAVQKAKLKLSDGRTATFTFSAGQPALRLQRLDLHRGHRARRSSGLHAGARRRSRVARAGTDADADAASPESCCPQPAAADPAPTPPAASNLRVLFLYDPLLLTGMPPGQQAILAAPELRSYLDKHCPLESGCAERLVPLEGRQDAVVPLPADQCRRVEAFAGLAADVSLRRRARRCRGSWRRTRPARR